MTIFYICRHGETENNKNGLLSGWADTPLTENGIQNAAASAAKLSGINFDRVISSDLGRAVSTARIIVKELWFSGEIEQLPGLREVNYGELANKPFSSHPKLPMSEKSAYAPPGGESLQSMQERVVACINNIGSESDRKTVLIVAHDGTINALNAFFTNRDIGVVDTESNNTHDFVARLEMKEGKILSFNEISLKQHLPY